MTHGYTINNYLKFVFSFFLFLLLLLPTIGFSQGTNASKINTDIGITYECGDGDDAGNCTFGDLVAATKKVVDFGVKFTLFFSVIVIVIAGYNLMISGDNPGKRKEARDMLWKVAKGIAYILLAWLIVSLILSALKVDSPIKF